MVATEYHLDRRVRSFHRGAEIATTGSRDRSEAGELDDKGVDSPVEAEVVDSDEAPMPDKSDCRRSRLEQCSLRLARGSGSIRQRETGRLQVTCRHDDPL